MMRQSTAETAKRSKRYALPSMRPIVSNGMDAPTRTGIRVPQWKCHQPLEPKGASTMKITTVGIDLAKDVFQVHGIDEHGKAVLRKQLRRDQMAAFFVNLPPCLIGMEACGSAHHWGRKLASMGHTVRLMAPQFVKPYVKTNKNDAADAEAICEAEAYVENASRLVSLLLHGRQPLGVN